LISGNSSQYGGGLYSCSKTIGNCTISGNSANRGGGLAYYDGRIFNCVIWGNDAPVDPELSDCDTVVVNYSCVRGWTGSGIGNTLDDPLFVMGPLGDYYLSCIGAGQNADSPCIDAGIGASANQGLDELTTRTDGITDTGVVDMGYHYPTSLNQNPQIECRLNASEFLPGDALVGLVEARNPGPDVTVDVYIAFVLPSGALISLTANGLTNGTHPWISNVTLPGGFDFGLSEVFRTTATHSPGDYLFAAALTEPGELDFIGEVHIFPFAISE